MTALEIIAFVILTIPTAYELWNERTGEAKKNKRLSTLVRIVIALASTWVAAVFKNDNLVPDLIKSALMAFAIFFLCFDYLFNIIFHRKTRVWYSYLSKSPIDNVWSKVGWRWRMGIKVAVFIISLIIYLWN